MVGGICAEDGGFAASDIELQGRVLDALHQILERCGESLVAGWPEILAIISSAFEQTEKSPPDEAAYAATRAGWDCVGNDLVSVQIDFLVALSLLAMPDLLELLHRFTMQSDDLNMALTTVSAIMSVAEHLVNNGAATAMDSLCETMDDTHESLPWHDEVTTKISAQLALLLDHLRVAVNGAPKEVRNTAFQTLCNILRASGNQLSPEAWDFLLRSTVLKTLVEDARMYFDEDGNTHAVQDRPARADEGMSKAIILGYADLVAQHIHIMERVKKLSSLWELYLNKLEAYLNCESHVLNQAVYTALTKVLSQVTDTSSTWTTPVYRTLALWLKRPPEESSETSESDNQCAFTAYVDVGSELYRLAKQSMGSSQIRELIDNVYHCVADSTGPSYGADTSSLSALQGKAMGLLKGVRLDETTSPANLVSVAAHLVVLHHGSVSRGQAKQGPTFIALSGEAMEWLVSLLRMHGETVGGDGIVFAIQSLNGLVKSKYEVVAKCKGTALWRRATSSLLELAQRLVDFPQFSRASLWAEYAEVAAAIVSAKGVDMAGKEEVYEDELADIESFNALKTVLIPRLGDPSLPDNMRLGYCRALFEASIIHRADPGEIPGIDESPLKNLQHIRRGRARRVPYSRRERMSYVCLEDLIALASMPSGPAEHLKLAQAAGPFVVLRLAMPIRGYIADRPLKGKSPQPLSELEELLFCFEKIKSLQLHPDALAADAESRNMTGHTAHLRFLYPLLAKAAAIAGDSWSGTHEVHQPLQTVLQAIVPFS
ncbi:Endocytosis and vacuole integrity protein [Teratosphaeriaceae sp. CCFEE 6253]|nr:Endocytosis and vacuole integrity protein [Teratosphaeriaceae sp. CCFEE 6253]